MAVDPARAKSLFLNASDLADPAERAAYLERECGDDAELRDRVEALLRADEDSPGPPLGTEDATIDPDAGRPATKAAGAHTPSPDLDPSPISMTAEYRGNPEPHVLIAGRYTLQEKIGEGGMGEVWVARQSEPVKRKVALKLIKPGMDSRAVLQRFEQERQALAMMDHPNIAKVLDAGLTPNGQPFFVMELVNGLPLNKFCDEARLKTNERLELFATICQAVQHAHQKGIVHRDLKPANILITMIDARPAPKVIDFGVAKATAGKLTDESMSTQFGAVVGTLEYMSPEQAGFSGEDIDTRADIYSLGVILYELLTGLRPIDATRLKKAALTEMIRIIREEEPSRPSTRLSTNESLPSTAALRQIEPRKLMALLRGDLDWVVMKCLEKHRERRYETANALARDVRRYLDGDAVEACPPSVGYRMGKFLKRNRGPALAASVALLALVVGMVGTTLGLIRADRAQRAERLQRTRAEAREEMAIAAVKRFGDAVTGNPELKNTPALEPLRKTLLKEPLAFFKALRDRLQEDRDTRPESLARLAAASSDLGILTDEIGDQRDALIAFRESLAIRRKLADAEPAVTRRQSALADGYNNIGLLLNATGKPAEALKAHESARAIRRKLADAEPTVTLYQSNLASSDNNIGGLLLEIGRPAEALKAYESARAIRRKLADAEPAVTLHRSDLAASHYNIGRLLYDTGKPAEALRAYESARAIFQRLADAEPAVAEHQSLMALCNNNIGNLLKVTGKPAEALRAYESARAIFQRLADAEPAVAGHQSKLWGIHTSIGNLLRETGKPAEALRTYESGRAIQRKLAEANPAVTLYQFHLAISDDNIGGLLRETGWPAEALKSHESGRAVVQTLVETNPAIPQYRSLLATIDYNIGLALSETGRPAEALKAYESARAILQTLTREHPGSPEFATRLGQALNNLAELEAAAGRHDASLDRIRQAIAWSKAALDSNPRNPIFRRFHANHLNNLLKVPRGLVDAAIRAEAERELAKLRDSDPAMMALDARLSAIIKGDQQPKGNADRLQLAQRSYDKALYATAARLWGEALAADPKLGDDRQPPHRYNAACAAALGAGGHGKDDSKPDDTARAKLRKQALDWLKAELSAWERVAMIVEPGNKERVSTTLGHWKQDADLASLRDSQELARLPEGEQKEWQTLWSDVDALLKRTQGMKP